MLIGCARVSKANDSQSLDPQRDALMAERVEAEQIYEDHASGAKDSTSPTWSARCRTCRTAGSACACSQARALRSTPPRPAVASCSASSRRWPNSSASSFRERTVAGLKAARARGRNGGRKFTLTKDQVRLAQAAMANRDTPVGELCRELGIGRGTLYRYVDPNGVLRDNGRRVLQGDWVARGSIVT